MSLINLFKKKKDYIDKGFENSEGLEQDIPNIQIIIDNDPTLYLDEIKEIKEMASDFFIHGGTDSFEEAIIVSLNDFDFIYDSTKVENGVVTIYLKSKEKTKSL